MARATGTRGKIERVRQVERWLRAAFPPPLPLAVRFVPKLADESGQLLGLASVNKGRCTIYIAWGPAGDMAETLLHEWAHPLTLPLVMPGDSPHLPEFWTRFGRIYVAYHEQGGCEASKTL
jgi:hypothetical protein